MSKNKYIIVRSGSVLKLLELIPANPNYSGSKPTQRVLWRFDLYRMIQVPFALLLIALFVYYQHEKYNTCMEIFNNFWYCFTR